MSLNELEQEYFDLARAAMPDWYALEENQNEKLASMAKMAAAGHEITQDWLVKQSAISTADGPIGDSPDWLGQHALDLGTSRRAGESDEALRTRLRNVSDAINLESIEDAIRDVLDSESIAADFYVLELPRDKSYFGEYQSETGTGGAFVASFGNGLFGPDGDWAAPPHVNTSTTPGFSNKKITFSGAAVGGNDGTYIVTGVVINSARYDSFTAVTGVDPGVNWELKKFDTDGNAVDGFSKAFMSRGYVIGSLRPTLMVLLPYEATESTEVSVREMIRTKKGAGVRVIIRRRLIP